MRMKIKKPANWKTAEEVRKTSEQINEELFAEELISIMDKILKAVAVGRHTVTIDVTRYEVPFVKELWSFLVKEGGYEVRVIGQDGYGEMMTIDW